jgi:DNA polymerase III epsilon subunit-like protein
MNELFISVDIEASGPIPGEFSMLSLGACVVGATHENFYAELKPLTQKFDAQALAVAGFDLKKLQRTGIEPARAMQQFDAWLVRVAPFDHTPIFCAYPLAFDWMFVAYYFHRFLGRNPFGYSGFDLKSFFMGASGKQWSSASVPQHFHIAQDLSHNALEDAIAQAKLLERVFEYANAQQSKRTRG